MSNPHALYDWSSIDWTKTNSELVFETGASKSAVSAARRRFAPGTKATRNPVLPCRNRGDITAFLETRQPGDQFWIEGLPADAWAILQSGNHKLKVKARCEAFNADPRRTSYGPPVTLTRVTIIKVTPIKP
jgi:hypothetical protein